MQRRTPSSGRVNHARLNHQQIKEQEALNKERAREDAHATNRKANLIAKQKEQYSHVTSGLSKENIDAHGVPRGRNDDVEIKVFVRECDPDSQVFAMMESAANQSKALPPAPQASTGARGGQTNLNGGLQRAPSGTRAPASRESSARGGGGGGATTLPGVAPQRGQVPNYLLKRKAELQAEKDLVREEMERQAELAKYPPGHRPVSEEERGDILAKLAERKRELEMELGRLPMRFDTQAIRNRQNQIEAEIAEVEAAERKFSVKKQLFVPI